LTKTLYVTVAFNTIIGSIQSLHVIWTVSHFMPCVGHMVLENVHEDLM
jgi:hypothetical protein